MIACKNSEISTRDCFLDVRKPIISGKGKEEFIEDYKLNRYACYCRHEQFPNNVEIIWRYNCIDDGSRSTDNAVQAELSNHSKVQKDI